MLAGGRKCANLDQMRAERADMAESAAARLGLRRHQGGAVSRVGGEQGLRRGGAGVRPSE